MPSVTATIEDFTLYGLEYSSGYPKYNKTTKYFNLSGIMDGSTINSAYLYMLTGNWGTINVYRRPNGAEYIVRAVEGDKRTNPINVKTLFTGVTTFGSNFAIGFEYRRPENHDTLNNFRSIKLVVDFTLPYTACVAPTTLTLDASISEGSTTLRWSGAEGGRNNAINGYEVQYCDSEDGSTWGSWNTHSQLGVVSSCAVNPPFTRGYYRKFRVRAKGAAGSSYYSDWKTSGTLRKNTAPSDPTNVSASPTLHESGSISLSWTNSTDATGSISGYKIQKRTRSSSSASWGAWEDETTVSTNSAVVSLSINRGAQAQYRIAAYDSFGVYSEYASTGTITQNSTPTEPGNFQSSVSLFESGNITLTWTASTDPDGNLDHYIITRQTSNDGNTWGSEEAVKDNITALTYTHTPGAIVRGRYVRYLIRAVDALGAKSSPAYSGVIRENTTPNAPTGLSISPVLYESGDIVGSWTASSDLTGTVAGYEISRRARENEGSAWSEWEFMHNTAALSFSFSPEMERGSMIQYRIRAFDQFGVYSDYAVFEAVTRNTLLDAPANLSASPTLFENEQITLSWNAPDGENETLDHYEVYYRTSGNGVDWSDSAFAANTQTEGIVLTPYDVSRGSLIRYMVRAVDILGASGGWATVNVRKNSAPQAPSSLSVVPNGVFEADTLRLSWPEAYDADGNVAHYQIACIYGTASIANQEAGDGNTVLAQITGLQCDYTHRADRGQYMRLAVRAVDSKGVKSPWRYADALIRRNQLPPKPQFAIPAAAGLTTWSSDPIFMIQKATDPDAQALTYEARIMRGGAVILPWKTLYTIRQEETPRAWRLGVSLTPGNYTAQFRVTDSVGATVEGDERAFTVASPAWGRMIQSGSVIAKEGDYAYDGKLILSQGFVSGKKLTMDEGTVSGKKLTITAAGISHQAELNELLQVVNQRRLWFGLSAVAYSWPVGYFANWLKQIRQMQTAINECLAFAMEDTEIPAIPEYVLNYPTAEEINKAREMAESV